MKQTISEAARSAANDIEQRLLRPELTQPELERLEKVSSVLKSAAELRKLEMETEKVRLETHNLAKVVRSESARYWISVSAPLVGAFAVVATLGFQIHQFNENSRLARQSSEGAQFREIVKGTQLPRGLSALTNLNLLTISRN